MVSYKLCQSCSLPFDALFLGWEERMDASCSDYCPFCYKNGSFTNTALSLEGMKRFVEEKLKELDMDELIIKLTLDSLSQLKRWKQLQEELREQECFEAYGKFK